MKKTTALRITLFVLAMLSSNAFALGESKFGIGGQVGYSSWGIQTSVWQDPPSATSGPTARGC